MESEIIIGHVLDALPMLDDDSVHQVVTSPPYWGLRDYKAPPVVWGDNNCEHEWGTEFTRKQSGGDISKYWKTGGIKEFDLGERSQGQFCGRCGAWRGQLGLEPTPELYVEHLVEIFREVKRVLRPDGTCWINLGDSYNSGAPGARDAERWPKQSRNDHKPAERRISGGSLKPKDLVGIPWRVAFALQADGWYLRSAIIWNKPNPMPESCNDRPTTAHEYIFLLTKSGASTYWTHRDLNGARRQPPPDYRWEDKLKQIETAAEPPNWRTEEMPDGEKRFKRYNLWRGHDYFYDADAVREPHQSNLPVVDKTKGGAYDKNTEWEKPDPYGSVGYHPAGRNLRDVWTITTRGTKDAHFAIFPTKLPATCIKTSPTKICLECGAGWERVTESEYVNPKTRPSGPNIDRSRYKNEMPINIGYRPDKVLTKEVTTLGFRPTCSCEGETGRAVILDPFAGSGTVGEAALKLGRDYILIEVNPDYKPLIEKRVAAITQPLIPEAL